jgi:hypothetical protein
MTRASPARDKLDALGIEAVCEALAGGTSMTALAKEVGVGFARLSAWLSDPDRSVRARDARRQAARMWDEMALQRIDEAEDAFQLAKAKEQAHHLRWRAKMSAPLEYGDRINQQLLDDKGQPANAAGIVMLMDFGDGKGPRTAAEIAKDRNGGGA